MAKSQERDLEHYYRIAQLQARTALGNRLITFLIVGVLALFFWLTIRELAGRQTFADVTFKAITDLKANHSFAMIASWLFAGMTTSWAFGERWLRKRHIARHADEDAKMQTKIDAGRQSSRLTKTGKTRPEDL